MNLILVALVSVFLATGIFNTEPKDSEGNKKTEIIVNESSETKLTEEQVKAEAQAQAEAEAKAAAEAQAQAEAEAKAAAEAKAQEEAESKAAAEAQKESKEADSLMVSETNYLRLALYIFGLILVVSIGGYFYFRQRDNSSSTSVTRTPDSSRRDFRKRFVVEPQDKQSTEAEVKPELQEEQPSEEEVKSELKKEQPSEEEDKSEPQKEQPPEDEKK